MNKNTPPYYDEPPCTDEEMLAAERLRLALEDPNSTDQEALLANSLRQSYQATDDKALRTLDPKEHALILEQVLNKSDLYWPKQKRDVSRARSTSTQFRWKFTAFAVAASLVFAWSVNWFRTHHERQAFVAKDVFRSREVNNLFDKPFLKEDPSSTRVDRIALSRERELRANRFAQWGVR